MAGLCYLWDMTYESWVGAMSRKDCSHIILSVRNEPFLRTALKHQLPVLGHILAPCLPGISPAGQRQELPAVEPQAQVCAEGGAGCRPARAGLCR